MAENSCGDMKGISQGTLGGWQVAGITSAQSGKAVRPGSCPPISATPEASVYGLTRLAIQTTFRLTVPRKELVAGVPTPAIKRWIAGITRLPSRLHHSRPARPRPTVLETPALEISVDPNWLISISSCKRTSRFESLGRVRVSRRGLGSL